MTDRTHRQSVVGAIAHPDQIEHVYMAVTAVENPTGESVYALMRQHMPVVAIDDDGLAALRKYAQQQAQRTGKTVSIICFTNRTLHETFSPVATGDNKS